MFMSVVIGFIVAVLMVLMDHSFNGRSLFKARSKKKAKSKDKVKVTKRTVKTKDGGEEAEVIEVEDNDEDEKFVRKERFYGECSRSFYIGEDIGEQDIKAEFKNGILRIEVPKKELNNQNNEVKQIEIK